MHAFTGCDTVSAFAGRGKAKALKLLTNSKEHQDKFLLLGQEWDVSPDLSDKLEAFTCHLFCAKKDEIESHQLPPCRDCFEACIKI